MIKQNKKKINSQLSNLSKSINTLPKLFKSFTSQKRSTKIKQTMEKKIITSITNNRRGYNN